MSNKIKNFNIKYNLDVNSNSFKFLTSEQIKEKMDSQQMLGKKQRMSTDIIKRFFSNKWNIIFTIILLILISLTIIAPLVSRYNSQDPVSQSTIEGIKLLRPQWQKDWNHVTETYSLEEYFEYFNDVGGPFDKNDVISTKDIITPDSVYKEVTFVNKYAIRTFLGTDTIGRDVWTRLFSSIQWSLSLAFFVAIIETIIGTIIGIWIGFHVGSRIDNVLMRFVEIFNSVPSLLWMFIFAMLFGTSFFSMAIVLIITGWVGPLYVARMFTLKVKEAEFIKAARSIGVSKRGVLFKHILPNIVGRLLVSFVHRIPAIIFFETTLVFLGMKVGGENAASIGNFIQEARSIEVIRQNLMFPLSITFFLLFFVTSLQIIANGIRDAFDPKTTSGRK